MGACHALNLVESLYNKGFSFKRYTPGFLNLRVSQGLDVTLTRYTLNTPLPKIEFILLATSLTVVSRGEGNILPISYIVYYSMLPYSLLTNSEFFLASLSKAFGRRIGQRLPSASRPSI